ncbi:50S ribosomal protein L25 [Candidatus Gottesmanbacteria bacterium]|nr:50S ribosomal protein L25 [Candidatus Gottesmanbacteria bacterium]
MKKHTLSGTSRKATGRKVKQLRAAGQLPGTVYGKKIKSESITVAKADFESVWHKAGETGLVELTGVGTPRSVLIHSVQLHPVTRALLHVEFFQVDLKEKVKTRVPIVLTGEVAAVREKTGVLLKVLDEVEVEALPTDLPEHLSLDVGVLKEVNQELKVSDITVPKGVTILADGGLTVVKIGSLVSREAEAQAAEEAAAAAAAAPTETAPAAEGAAAPAEEKKEETKPAGADKPAPTPAEEKKEA